MSRLARLGRALWRNEDGVTIVEFAIVCPVFLTMLLGMLDVGQMIYGKSVLTGAVENAARSSSLEAGDTAAADLAVRNQVKHILPGVLIESSRTSYFDFDDIARPEQWNDADADGDCNDGEAYTDENSNGEWDADVGVSGNGGASDVVLYAVTATYNPQFKIPFMSWLWDSRTLTAAAVRKNQPYANQEDYAATAGTCA